MTWCARIRRPAANACSSAAGATATCWGSSSPRAKRCSMRYGSTRPSRSSPFARSGAWATSSSGTTAAPCTAATPSTRARGASCTARRSGRQRPDQGAQLLHAVAVGLEIAPPEPGGGAYVQQVSRLEEFHIVDEAQDRRAELRVEIVALGSDDGRERQLGERRAQRVHAAAELDRRDVVLFVEGIGLRGDAVRRAPAGRKAPVGDAEVVRPPPVEHRRNANIDFKSCMGGCDGDLFSTAG